MVASKKLVDWRRDHGEDRPVQFVMDNAPIHAGTVQDREDVHKLPPYSPFLNPIENCFSIIKAAVKKRLREMRRPGGDALALSEMSVQDQQDSLRKVIMEAVEELANDKDHKIRNCCDKVGDFFTACIRQEDVLSASTPMEAMLTRWSDRKTEAEAPQMREVLASELAGPSTLQMNDDCPLCRTSAKTPMTQCIRCKRYTNMHEYIYIYI